MNASSRSFVRLATLGLALAACGGPSGDQSATGPPPPATTPAAMSISGGDKQTAVVFNAPPTPPAVLVTDATGKPVRNVSVNFTVTGGGGEVSGGQTVTNNVGVATVGAWVFGATEATQALKASSSGLPDVFFSGTSVAPITQLAGVFGDSLENGTFSFAVSDTMLSGTLTITGQRPSAMFSSSSLARSAALVSGPLPPPIPIAGKFIPSSGLLHGTGGAFSIAGAVIFPGSLGGTITGPAGPGILTGRVILTKPGTASGCAEIKSLDPGLEFGNAVFEFMIVGDHPTWHDAALDIRGATLPFDPPFYTSSSPTVVSVVTGGLSTVDALSPGFAIVTASCVDNPTAVLYHVVFVILPPVASVTVSPATPAVDINKTVQLNAILLGATGEVLTGRTVTWASSDPTIATVSAAGLVTALASGTVTITATSEGKSGTAAVTVTPVAVTSVSVTLATSKLLVGQTVQLTATPKAANGNPISGRAISWSSNSPAATVDGAGLVTASDPPLGLGGSASVTITATCEGIAGSASITVTAMVSSVVVSPAQPSVVLGQSAQFSAVLYDHRLDPLAGHTITWNVTPSTVAGPAVVSGQTRTASVLSVGLGSATITATSEGVSGTATLNVLPVPVATVEIVPSVVNLFVGDVQQLVATTKDSAGHVLTGRAIRWTSSNGIVAYVDPSSGMVTAQVAGTATITATSEGQAGTATVIVTPLVATVVVSPSTSYLLPGETVQLNHTELDNAGFVVTGRTVTWSSSAPAVATVNSMGLVTAVAAGPTVTVTAKETLGGVQGFATVHVVPALPGNYVGNYTGSITQTSTYAPICTITFSVQGSVTATIAYSGPNDASISATTFMVTGNWQSTGLCGDGSGTFSRGFLGDGTNPTITWWGLLAGYGGAPVLTLGTWTASGGSLSGPLSIHFCGFTCGYWPSDLVSSVTLTRVP